MLYSFILKSTLIALLALPSLSIAAPAGFIAPRLLRNTSLKPRSNSALAKLSILERHEGHDDEDPQSSHALDDSVIQQSLNSNGISDGVDPNTTPSMTSSNNFINYCKTQSVPLTDGKQVEEGSCNPTPMGRIIAKNKMPSSKFTFPYNGAVVEEGKAFNVTMAVRNFQTGIFANAATNYLGAPQTVNDQGLVMGHSHLVIEAVGDYTSKDPLNPEEFTFFKGMNRPPTGEGVEQGGGVLSAEVPDGLPVGVYRLTSINTAVNHQPLLVSVAQHGGLDDTVYFEVISSESFETSVKVRTD